MDQDRGLTIGQKILNIPLAALFWVLPGIVIVAYLFALAINYNTDASVIYKDTTWYWVLFWVSVVSGIITGIASRFRRPGTLVGGTCSKTCGEGTITGRGIGKPPLFGGHIPLKKDWNGGYCFVVSCGTDVEVLSTISITTPSPFNQNGLTAVPVYYPSNPIKAPFTGKNDKVIFHDHCNCEAEDLGGNTYKIQTTTGYLSSTGGNIIKTTDVVGTKTPSQPDTTGVIDVYGQNGTTVTVTTKNNDVVFKQCELQVNIDILYADTIYSVKLNGKELLPATSSTNLTPAPISTPSSTPSQPALYPIQNIQMTSKNNTNKLEITMKYSGTAQGFLMYSVYDSNNSTNVYMQSNGNSTKAEKI